jgi:hypothetical protein
MLLAPTPPRVSSHSSPVRSLHRDVEMVLQVRADRRTVGNDVDPERAQMIRRTDARQHQEFRGFERAAGQHHRAFGPRALALAAMNELHAGRALALECDALGQRTGHDCQIRPLPRRVNVGARGAHAFAVRRRPLHHEGTVETAPVDVRRHAEPRLFQRREIGAVQRMVGGGPGDTQRAVIATPGIVRATAVFHALEVRQAMREGPVLQPLRRPAVIVEPVAAQIDHAVDRGRAAEHASARIENAAPAEPRIGFALILRGIARPGGAIHRGRHAQQIEARPVVRSHFQ